MRFLEKREISAIGELVVVVSYQLEKEENLKDAIKAARDAHGVVGEEDCRLEVGNIVRCFIRKKMPITVCPSKPNNEPKKGEDRWEEEVQQVKRKKR